jgi:hypothetical protein
MDYYLALQKDKVLSFVPTWMNVEDIILSKVSQAQEDK